MTTATKTKKPATTKAATNPRDLTNELYLKRNAFVQAQVENFLRKILENMHLVNDAVAIGIICRAMRQMAIAIDDGAEAGWDDGFTLKFSYPNYESLEAVLGIYSYATDMRSVSGDIELEESENGFDAKQAADSSFSNEFNRWLQTVVDSQCVDSVLNAGLLCRAIKAHAASYLTETVGMNSRDAADQFKQIVNGEAEADEGHRIYGILGIVDPSE